MQRNRKGRDQERAAAGRDRDHGRVGTQKPKKAKMQRGTGEENDRGMKGDRGDPEGGRRGGSPQDRPESGSQWDGEWAGRARWEAGLSVQLPTAASP